MKKTKIIREIVGEKLKDYGFSFLKTDGPCRIFIREVQGVKRYYDPEKQEVKQYVSIQESNFSQALIARFYTDVYGNEMVHELEELRKYGTGGWIKYTDEDSYKEKLQLLTKLIIEHGLDLLERMSCEEEAIPTKLMAEKLFHQHKQLELDFTEEFHMKAVAENSEDIEEWFQIIKQLIISASEKPYEEVKELFVGMAAFIGERNCELLGAKWFFKDYLKTPFTQKENYQGMCFFPLNEVVGYYRACKDNRKNILWFANEITELKQAFQESK